MIFFFISHFFLIYPFFWVCSSFSLLLFLFLSCFFLFSCSLFPCLLSLVVLAWLSRVKATKERKEQQIKPSNQTKKGRRRRRRKRKRESKKKEREREREKKKRKKDRKKQQDKVFFFLGGGVCFSFFCVVSCLPSLLTNLSPQMPQNPWKTSFCFFFVSFLAFLFGWCCCAGPTTKNTHTNHQNSKTAEQRQKLIPPPKKKNINKNNKKMGLGCCGVDHKAKRILVLVSN